MIHFLLYFLDYIFTSKVDSLYKHIFKIRTVYPIVLFRHIQQTTACLMCRGGGCVCVCVGGGGVGVVAVLIFS